MRLGRSDVENRNGRIRMQTVDNINFVLTDVFSFRRFADLKAPTSYRGFYQLIASELIGGIREEQVFRKLGDNLILLAEHAHAFRRMDELEDVSRHLMSLSLPGEPREPGKYEMAGRYYHALCVQNFGRGDAEQASRLLGPVAGNAPPGFRARAMISLAANSRNQGDNLSALPLYCEAARFNSQSGLRDPYVTVHTQKMAAVITSENGNHHDAVTLLENLFPLAHHMRSSQPHVYYDYLNSLAVELCEVGRLKEASDISNLALASPFAAAYPEWRETSDEIALKSRRASRSVVAFSNPASESERENTSESGNVLQLVAPPRSGSASLPSASLSFDGRRDSVATRRNQRARVISLLEWKNEATERKGIFKDRQTRLKELRQLPTEDKIAEIWGRLGDENVDDDLLCEALLILEDYQPEQTHGL